MDKKERILLDAELLSVIGDCAFHAKLGNGHQIVAFADGADKAKLAGLTAGHTVKVSMSPYDMSKGCIIFETKDLE
ncbi:MAG: translation initiation factor IF-1 [Spartobacteria bacterium]|nr:translation initiation factor IF-1 [Spartobacteria bacterium]